MPPKILDFPQKDTLSGFRLKRLEMYNWGTFHQDVWEVTPQGFNSLLTGDIGSGKSTVVDAVTTLLIPHHRIVYNKAAGADSKERSLYSYVRGDYKKVQFDHDQGGKPVALRDENSYTVLLGSFYNAGYKQTVTLAQVFWIKDQNKNPERFFVISEATLTIAHDFADFGTNILDLKKRLKNEKHIRVIENFKTYSSRFCQLFGIKNHQALDLFYQTVSMKSVGNLTDFIRKHMLDEQDVESRLDDIRKNFDNLNQAHEAVLKAKSQIGHLEPLQADGAKYHTLEHSTQELRTCRDALNSYFAGIQSHLLHKKIKQLEIEIEKRVHHVHTIDENLRHLREQESNLKASIEDNGGRRLEDIQREVNHLQKERDQKQEKEQTYRDLVARLALDPVQKAEDFFTNRKKAQLLLKRIERGVEQLQLKQVDLQVNINATQKTIDQLTAELESLKNRKSNIPLKNLMIRKEMAHVLGVDESEMPFAGELLQVDETAQKWEGALERLLGSFGLSLLISDKLYPFVSRYVDQTDLKGRLVYFRVRGAKTIMMDDTPDPGLVVHKIRIKPDSAFYDWLTHELHVRYGYVCCDSEKEFQRQPKAITVNGQIKTGGRRHEKDDRYPLHDRSRYILGWQNREKIRALNKMVAEHEAAGRDVADQLNALIKKQHAMVKHRDHCRDILYIESYDDILWQPVAGHIQTLLAEKQKIETGSDILRTLKQQLTRTQTDIATQEKDREKHSASRYKSQQKMDDSRKEMQHTLSILKEVEPAERKRIFPRIKQYHTEALPEKTANLNNLAKCHSDVRQYIQKQIDNQERKLRALTEKIITQMQTYKSLYPAETSEADASIAALDEYAAMLANLKAEDLPRHEATFKRLLNEGTINSIALFKNQLEKERQEIEKKIALINRSVSEIEYSPGTLIELLFAANQDSEIRDFQQSLKQCLSHTLDGADVYNEQKFLQVKALLNRFNGREGFVELDRKWTSKVTDVRNWFVFSAVERWREDGKEKEYYSDSSGKSGGQKEKLAYTILASALAYQFGLEWGRKRSRTFRFVVIDEAFGRGSDDSTRYGLELFSKLDLQLLIVTPLQKINIIEDYIRNVHFVHNDSGKYSLLKNLTVEEYRRQKEEFKETQP